MKRVGKYDRTTGALLGVYPSLTEAARSVFGGDRTNICACCCGRVRSAYGYVWRYYRIVSDSDTGKGQT